ILIQPISDLRPADLIIKLAYLLLGILNHVALSSAFHSSLPGRREDQFFHSKGSPTKKRKVSPNCAFPSWLKTFSTGHTFRSSQKFIRRQGKGRGYSKKNR